MQTKENSKKENLKKSNQESKALTREYIKTALLHLIKETPYEKITVTAIINRAGVSRAGFYRNYGSKEEVLEDIATSIYNHVSLTYLSDIEKKEPYERYRFLFERLKEQAQWFQILTMVRKHHQHIFNMATYIEEFLNPQTIEEHYRYIAIAHSQRAIIIDWFEHGMKESPEEMATIFCNLFQGMHL